LRLNLWTSARLSVTNAGYKLAYRPQSEAKMNRRLLLQSAIAAPMIAATAAKADGHGGKTAFVLVHGSWHGAWCWGLVEPYLQRAGHMTLAIDLPGHGLNARNPAAFAACPADPAALAGEPSALAGIPVGDFAAAVQDAAMRARTMGADRVIAVGHSMGGVPVTFAAATRPDLFDDIVYLAALAPTPGKPAGAYLGSEDQSQNSRVGDLIVADPAQIGALRMNPRSTDAAYLAGAKQALAADLSDGVFAQLMHMLTPDAPVAMYGQTVEFADGFAALNRTFIRCTGDVIVVASLPEAIVADLNAAFPGAPTALVDLDASHEAIVSAPEALAAALNATV